MDLIFFHDFHFPEVIRHERNRVRNFYSLNTRQKQTGYIFKKKKENQNTKINTPYPGGGGRRGRCCDCGPRGDGGLPSSPYLLSEASSANATHVQNDLY